MRILRYVADGDARYGIVRGDTVHRLDGNPFESPEQGQEVGNLTDLRILAPCEPTKVLCVGRNYGEHIKEMGRPWPAEPFSFLKAPNTVVGPEEPIFRPPNVERFHYEGELAVVMGRSARGLSEEDWKGSVAGFTCANDMTVRDWQQPEVQWLRAKGSDTLCPLGPWIETEIDDPESLHLQTRVNGEVRQDGSTSDFVFGIGAVLAYLSATITLEPGDVVLTGTPGGVGPVVGGDTVEVQVEGIGTLRNPIKQA